MSRSAELFLILNALLLAGHSFNQGELEAAERKALKEYKSTAVLDPLALQATLQWLRTTIT